ncbi:hypothetical protein [Methylocapsa sp. S129]|uniref:hypothetical protein n=1 Tax=Methylocapsa sp. S129 TaxID=1641869 RepID=UPI00131E3A24|nr:hypothetical protein [Methylocapsa sp. S129]
MKAEDVAALFDDRTGYALVDFEEVGSPAYRLTTTVLTLQAKHYPAIDEFILRAVDVGLGTVADLSGFLGVDERVIEASASGLIREDDLTERESGVLVLTTKSQKVLLGETPLRPKEQSLVFHYDALTRRPISGVDLRLLAPRELRERGMREVRAYPPKKPEPEDIDADELQNVLRTVAGRTDEQFRILRVQSVTRGAALFIPAVMLIYRRNDGDDVRVSFAIDGRLSEEHERAFLEAGGPAKMGIVQAILSSPAKPPLAELIGAQLAQSVEKLPDSSSISRSVRNAAIARFKAEIAQKRGLPAPAPAEPALDHVEPARPVPVYEHPRLLEMAFETAINRVILISPWVTDAVVDVAFIKRLRMCLQRGVVVYIGYGIGGPDERETDALRELQKIAKADERLTLLKLGDTHAKVLIKDTDWFVTTSFNWLSFKGDPKRTFREEWGTQVGVRSVVDKYALEILQRFRSNPAP